jgi:integrase
MRLNIKAIEALKSNGRDVVYWDDEVPRYGLRVKPSGVKSFIVQYRTAQARARKLTIGRYGPWAPEQARVEAKRLLRLVDQGIDPAEIADKEKEAITVAKLCDEYLEAARAGVVATRSGQPKKASTLHQDAYRISVHIRPLLGSKLVKDLIRAEVRRFFEVVARGKKAKVNGKSFIQGGTTAAKRSVGLLGGMLTYAGRLGYRPEEDPNPAHGIGMPADNRRQFRLETAGWRTLGEVIQAAEERGIAWQVIAIAKLLALTGCRLDEVSSLRWDEIDFASRCFRFDLSRIKGGPMRPIGQDALAILRNLRDDPTRNPDSTFVFPMTRKAELDLPYQGFHQAWRRVNPSYSAHCIRHAFASTAEGDCGLHESTVAAILGHNRGSGNVTRGYILKPDALLLAAADKVCRHIWQAMTGEAPQGEIVQFPARA